MRWLLASLLVVLLAPAQARDPDGRYENSPHKPWFDRQHNHNGTSCCLESDAHRYDGGYEFNADGSVTLFLNPPRTLPQALVLNGHNPTGAAIYWYRDYENGQRTDYCFSPGSLT